MPLIVMSPPLEEISANAPEPVPASISMPSDEIVTVLAALPTVIWAKESKILLPVKTSRLEAVALILPLVVVIRALPDVPASKESLPVALAVMLPLVLVVTAPPLSIVMPPVVPPPAVPVSWIAPVTVLTAVEDPVMKIPSLEDDPDAEPVPDKVIGALLVVVIAPPAAREIPRLEVVVPLPVPVRLIPLPVAVVIRELEPITKIPLQPLVPVPPRHVPEIEPLVELIFPAADTSRPLLPVPVALLLPVPLTIRLPETVVMVELDPLTVIPLQPSVPDAPVALIVRFPWLEIEPAARIERPTLLLPVPRPVAVIVIGAELVVTRVPAPEMRTPLFPVVPVEEAVPPKITEPIPVALIWAAFTIDIPCITVPVAFAAPVN
jgi:hypothetical protein